MKDQCLHYKTDPVCPNVFESYKSPTVYLSIILRLAVRPTPYSLMLIQRHLRVTRPIFTLLHRIQHQIFLCHLFLLNNIQLKLSSLDLTNVTSLLYTHTVQSKTQFLGHFI